MKYTIIEGDNRLTLKTLEDDSVDSIVTDPPYGIDFLGEAWDANTGALETYRECLRVLKPGGYILAFSAARTYHHLAVTLERAGFEIRDQLMWLYASGFPKAIGVKGHDGWKTALKPAHEPIAMARKPFKGSTIDNMNTWGVGALNIDASRVGSEAKFPSNVLGAVEGYQKFYYCPKVSRKERHIGFDLNTIPTDPSGKFDRTQEQQLNANERIQNLPGNNHPTVKPVELMKYLIRLVTPLNGVVLDPFAGSGSTGMAAVELEHTFIGCELDPAYVEIAKKRIEAWNTTEYDNTFAELFDEGQ